MKLFNIFKKNKTKFITKELISLNALAKVPDIDYFKDNNQFLLLINLRKKEYLETLIKEKVLTSSELKSKELQDKLNMLHNLIEQNTLGNDLFEKVIFDEEDKVKALIILRKFTIYNEKIIELEEEVVSRIIALKEILKRTFLNKPKRISIINEVNRLTNVFIILMNQKETLRVCLSNYSKKCFDITKERDKAKEETLIKKRKKELNEYQEQAFGKRNIEINNLNDMAKVEVALEDYVYNYKWKMFDLDKQLELYENDYKKILEIENKCKLYYEFGKNIINKEDLKKLYRLKFKYFTHWRYANGNPVLIKPFINEETSKLELEVYEEIIFGFINDIYNNNHSFFSLNSTFGDYSFKVLNLLKKELQTNGKYETLEILKDKYKLNLLMAFSYPINIDAMREIYKKNYVKKSDYPEINFYESEFEWNEYLPLETINELKLIQNQKKDIGLYLFVRKYYYLLDKSKLVYYLPEGLKKVGLLDEVNGSGLELQNQTNDNKNFVKFIRQNMEGKVVVFPTTLKYVLGDLIGNTEIKELRLNKGLEYFNFNFSSTSNIKKILIPSTVIPFSYGLHKQDGAKLETIHFYNFDKSFFYNNIENLKSLFIPYIKIVEDEIVYSQKKGIKKNFYRCELTIDKIIIDFSNNDFPTRITIKKERCYAYMHDYSIEKGIYALVEKLNERIMEEVAIHRGVHVWELTK